MELSDIFDQIEDYFAIKATTLAYHAARYPYADVQSRSGSGSPQERQILYALIKVTKPDNVLECGTAWGFTTTAIAAGLEDDARFWSVDPASDFFGHKPGKYIPGELRSKVELVQASAEDWLTNHNEPLSLIFEDADHSVGTVATIWTLAAAGKLATGGLIISHDALQPRWTDNVQTGIAASGVEGVLYVETDDSACGFAIWQKPKTSRYHSEGPAK